MKKVKSGRTFTVAVLCGTMMWTACSTAWITEAEQIVGALIPATTNLVALVKANASPGMMAMAAKQVKKQAPLTASQFVASYNATLTAKTGNAELDHAAAGLRIHVHEKFARWASAGLLK